MGAWQLSEPVIILLARSGRLTRMWRSLDAERPHDHHPDSLGSRRRRYERMELVTGRTAHVKLLDVVDGQQSPHRRRRVGEHPRAARGAQRVVPGQKQAEPRPAASQKLTPLRSTTISARLVAVAEPVAHRLGRSARHGTAALC